MGLESPIQIGLFMPEEAMINRYFILDGYLLLYRYDRKLNFNGDKSLKIIKDLIRFTIITSAFFLIASHAVVAQGNIFGTVLNSDETTSPAMGQLTFFGYLDNTDEEIRIETSTGAGYDGLNWYDDFQAYLTEAAGNPYDFHFYNS